MGEADLTWMVINIGTDSDAQKFHIQKYSSEGWNFHSASWNGAFVLGYFFKERSTEEGA